MATGPSSSGARAERPAQTPHYTSDDRGRSPRRRVAQQFAAWLFQNRPTTTRAAARVLIELCFLGAIDGDRQALERELAWWAGEADLKALRAMLIAERRSLNELWTAVNRPNAFIKIPATSMPPNSLASTNNQRARSTRYGLACCCGYNALKRPANPLN